MIFITGDCHGDWSRFAEEYFYEQKEMTRDDIVICCGDFGIWYDTDYERASLDWLGEKGFTICFVDGNHENFDKLEGGIFPEINFCGGKAHKIKENIYHLERGYVFNFQGQKFFCFGGASSHDIKDGILDENDFDSHADFSDKVSQFTRERKEFRINHWTWWEREMPSEEEMQRGIKSLEMNNWNVDFVITHCAPQSVASVMSNGFYKPDILTMYFNGLLNRLKFNKWFFGHYHDNKAIMSKFIEVYDQIIRIY